ncbi:hypothetical protein M433DRAFT_366263 [Acidomyces richmondensis BFW]|nr:MAG: hypothetical protein FE78DRAFT_195832 [Acidomyces sp. 'richmondensis']KYG48981.1 hypothetical protein M433DRAFT_366263 [Acidomyces richmondensis BFW]
MPQGPGGGGFHAAFAFRPRWPRRQRCIVWLAFQRAHAPATTRANIIGRRPREEHLERITASRSELSWHRLTCQFSANLAPLAAFWGVTVLTEIASRTSRVCASNHGDICAFSCPCTSAQMIWECELAPICRMVTGNHPRRVSAGSRSESAMGPTHRFGLAQDRMRAFTRRRAHRSVQCPR